jgi:nucleoside-diphosphate-sugar epimerase
VATLLVTGAAGFIGSHLCDVLLARGWTVRGLDSFNDFYEAGAKWRNLQGARDHPRFELIQGDLSELPLDEVLEGVDAVAHLAGEPGVSPSWGSAFERYVNRNVQATQRLLEAVCRQGVRRLVYASSSSVYGAATDALAARGEPRPKSPYGVSKLAAEALVGAYASCFDLTAVSLRYFSVYGPRQRPDMAAHRFIEALLDGQNLTVYGDGSQVRDYTYVGDVVDATVRALTADVPRAAVFDVACGNPQDVTTLIATLRELFGAERVEVDRRDERRGDVQRTEGKIDLAREWLGWVPQVDLRTGLARQLAWHAALRPNENAGDGRAATPLLAGATGSPS